MKKFILTIVFGLSIATIHAQDVSDAVRLAQNNLTGTARFAAMSGAFGALGGDLSAINVNPAGSVVFANNLATVTLLNQNRSNDSNYFGSKTNDSKHSIDINQAGGVFVFDNDQKSDWEKFAIGINYENGLLDNNQFSSGVNPTNSVSDYFLYYANRNGGVSDGLLILQSGETIKELYTYLGSNDLGNISNFDAQQAFLGYQAYIIDTDPLYNDINNRKYITNVSALGGNYSQQNTIAGKGYNGKLAFNTSAQYQNWLSIGLSLNSHFTDYRQNQQFIESNYNPKYATGSTVDYIRFNNEIYTYGTGFSFQLGAIAKASKEVRLGVAYESPTWYHLNDEFIQDIYTKGFGLNFPVNNSVYGSKPIDPKVINVSEPYTLRTPSKLTGSIAYIFGKRGLLSLDYAIKNYTGTQFGPNNQFSNPTTNNTNNDIKRILTNSSNEIRLGAEYKINQWSLRGGLRHEGSPYNDKKIMSDLKGFSTGLGYNWGATRLDMSYSRSERSSQESFFNQGLLDTANINSVFNNVNVTLVFEL